MNRIIKNFVIPSLALLVTACAHHPSQYSTYSSNNAYYPNYPSNGSYQNNRSYYPRPPRPYVYRSYRQPYSGAYQSNTVNNNYYYRNNNNNTYRPIQPWPNGHHDEHPNHFPSPNRYGYPNGNWHDHDRDRDHHSSNDRNWHENNRFSNGQPIPYHREEHRVDRPHDNYPNGRPHGEQRPPSSNWSSEHNRNENGAPRRPEPVQISHEERHNPIVRGDIRQHNGNERGHDDRNRNDNRHGQPGFR